MGHAASSARVAAGLAAILAAVLSIDCSRREPPEHALARSRAAFVREQIASLKKTIGQVERGEMSTTDHVAIGLSEDLAKRLLNASLPMEVVVASRLRIRIESVNALFRGGKAALLFKADVASVDISTASASLDIGGTLEDFALKDGRLRTRAKVAHFAVRESGLGDLAADVIEGLVRSNLHAIEDAIPAVEIPVELDRSITIGGLEEGPVVAKGGSLPLDVEVSQVIVGKQRLWVLLRADVGRWRPSEEGAVASGAAGGKPPARKETR
jgi:hypothetical protein